MYGHVRMQIGLWDIKGGRPAVRHVPIFEEGEVMCPLEDALPLRALLAPICDHADKVVAALEVLQPEQTGALGFASAMSAVLDYAVRRCPLTPWGIRSAAPVAVPR